MLSLPDGLDRRVCVLCCVCVVCVCCVCVCGAYISNAFEHLLAVLIYHALCFLNFLLNKLALFVCTSYLNVSVQHAQAFH